MSTIHWLFLVSTALFISSIAFVIAGARPGGGPAPIESPPLTPVASIRHIMNGTVMPATNVIYNAVSTSVTAAGVEEIAPQSDEEWEAIEISAAMLAESGNLLLIGNRAIDKGEWVTMTQAMIDAAMVALKAAQAKDAQALFASGSHINMSCENCHRRYSRSTP